MIRDIQYHYKIIFLIFTIIFGLILNTSILKAEETIKIGYSDWPGWVIWEVAIEKEWFKDAGVNVEFVWLDYVESMEEFSKGKLDAVCMTNGDALVIGAAGKKSKGILINDFSNGNDMIIARKDVKSVLALRGKRIGVEIGYVGHLLLNSALKLNKISSENVTLVNIPTHKTPEALKDGKVDAIVAWQPHSGRALKITPNSNAIFTSADVKGLIYDLLFVDPEHLKLNRDSWRKIVHVWFKIIQYINKNEKNFKDSLKIMSKRVGVLPKELEILLKGTALLDLKGNQRVIKTSTGCFSIIYSTQTVDDFNVKHGIYSKSQNIHSYFDFSILFSRVIGDILGTKN